MDKRKEEGRTASWKEGEMDGRKDGGMEGQTEKKDRHRDTGKEGMDGWMKRMQAGQKEAKMDRKVWTESLKEGWTDRSNRRMEDRTEEGKDGWKKMELQTEG